jgi:hypothetical protein
MGRVRAGHHDDPHASGAREHLRWRSGILSSGFDFHSEETRPDRASHRAVHVFI